MNQTTYIDMIVVRNNYRYRCKVSEVRKLKGVSVGAADFRMVLSCLSFNRNSGIFSDDLCSHGFIHYESTLDDS